jgi:hypothetical protein
MVVAGQSDTVLQAWQKETMSTFLKCETDFLVAGEVDPSSTEALAVQWNIVNRRNIARASMLAACDVNNIVKRVWTVLKVDAENESLDMSYHVRDAILRRATSCLAVAAKFDKNFDYILDACRSFM